MESIVRFLRAQTSCVIGASVIVYLNYQFRSLKNILGFGGQVCLLFNLDGFPQVISNFPWHPVGALLVYSTGKQV
jgi:hypothetical protein